MSGVSITGPSPVDEELQAIYVGGDNFLARMKAMSDAKAAAAAAAVELQRVQAIRTTLDEAQAQKDEALKIRRQADAVLKKATEDAAATVAAAQADGDAAAAIAKELLVKAKADADKIKADAEFYMQAAKQSADEMVRNAVALEKQSKQRSDELATALANAKNAQDKADKVRAQYEAKLEKVKQTATRMASVLAEARE